MWGWHHQMQMRNFWPACRLLYWKRVGNTQAVWYNIHISAVLRGSQTWKWNSNACSVAFLCYDAPTFKGLCIWHQSPKHTSNVMLLQPMWDFMLKLQSGLWPHICEFPCHCNWNLQPLVRSRHTQTHFRPLQRLLTSIFMYTACMIVAVSMYYIIAIGALTVGWSTACSVPSLLDYMTRIMIFF